MQEINGLRILGLGGIGGALLDPVLRYMTYSHRQDEPLDVTLVDGDEYETKNLVRQACSEQDVGKNKAQAAFDKVKTTFDMLDVNIFTEYITPDNIASVIKNGDVVMMGFDNHKSRKLVADHCGTLNNITLISGGNEWTDGNVQVFVKRDGERLTANINEYHPEIENPKDKSPGELGCVDLIASAPQLLAMNLSVASFMFNAMYFVLNRETEEALQGKELYGEVYVDIADGKAAPRVRNPLAV